MPAERVTVDLPLYQSHKRVRALRIASIGNLSGNVIDVAFFDRRFGPVTLDTINRPVPEPGWYYVLYEDGYYSFSPAKQFEEGYSPI